ncbi:MULTISPECIES: SAM-dependent methyltransferase [unclassified Nocardiopsis]|uniref:SAM-dependent methyltransferase n=1 Tax=unclassified Nocardiopsis TaxID=2649073 RepID=UPI0013592086|nr:MULTISPECIES: SAM-dependent methyltransferase [unclassified Nocardiopsis]
MTAHTTEVGTCRVADLQAALLGTSCTPQAEAHARVVHQALPRVWELSHAGRDWIGTLLAQLSPLDLAQVADLGCGLPRRSPSSAPDPVDTHEYAFAAGMGRCAYLDCDPDVVACRTGLALDRGGAAVADITDPCQVRAALAACAINLGEPVVLVLGWVLALLDDDQAHGVLASLSALAAEGSYLAVSHPTGWGPWSTLLTRATGARVRSRSAQDLLDLLAGAGLHPHQGPTPVDAWPQPACPTPGTDVLCALARIGGAR